MKKHVSTISTSINWFTSWISSIEDGSLPALFFSLIRPKNLGKYAHRVHVWYIYPHVPSKSTIHVGEYTSPMDPSWDEARSQVASRGFLFYCAPWICYSEPMCQCAQSFKKQNKDGRCVTSVVVVPLLMFLFVQSVTCSSNMKSGQPVASSNIFVCQTWARCIWIQFNIYGTLATDLPIRAICFMFERSY